jgi:anti-anti-sigma factor
MAGSSLRLERRTEPRGEVVELAGELDLTNAAQLDEALAGTTAAAVFLDLTRLTFIDSAGLRAIDRGRTVLVERGRRLVLVAPPDSRAAWTFRVAGLAGELLAGDPESPASQDGGAAADTA